MTSGGTEPDPAGSGSLTDRLLAMAPALPGARALGATIGGFALVLIAIVAWLAIAGAPPGLKPRNGGVIALPKPVNNGTAATPAATPRQQPAAAAPPTATPRSTEALAPAPDPALVEAGTQGPLPKVAADGRKAWQVYARPFDGADKRPRIAIILTGLGLSGVATESAVNSLPGAVTLAFNPYAARLTDWIDRARSAGHEVLLALAMEPSDYPRVDPGPHTLLVALEAKENLERLDWVLSRTGGYVGVVSSSGSRFTTSKSDLLPVLDEIKKRGLMFVDSRPTEQSVAGALAKSIGLPRSLNDVAIDYQATRDAIDQSLAQLETLSKQNGAAVGIGDLFPVTIERVAQWAATVERRGFALAPVSATANMQPDRGAGADP